MLCQSQTGWNYDTQTGNSDNLPIYSTAFTGFIIL